MINCESLRLETCFHCGNKGFLEVIFKHRHTYGGPVYGEFGEPLGYEPEEIFDWYLVSCPVCHKVSLVEEYYFEEGDESVKFLYPQERTENVGVPVAVRSAFESALKVRYIDGAICCLSLRRTLEAICKDKNANGSTLEDMVKDMIKEKVLPDMFNDACWCIRQLGNSAAHADNRQFREKDIEQIIDFMKNIINYLYCLPSQMHHLRTFLELEKQSKSF